MFHTMAMHFFKLHYQKEISKHLTKEQKKDIAKRISEATLKAPIWTFEDVDYSKSFPEIAPHINVKLDGLYLCSILEAIVEEFQGKKISEMLI